MPDQFRHAHHPARQPEHTLYCRGPSKRPFRPFSFPSRGATHLAAGTYSRSSGFGQCHPPTFPPPGYAHSRAWLIRLFHHSPCGPWQNAAALLFSRDHRYSLTTCRPLSDTRGASMSVCYRRCRRSSQTLAGSHLTARKHSRGLVRYLRTTLTVPVDPLAPRLRTPSLISSTRPLVPHDFRRVGSRKDVSPSIRIEGTTSCTSSGLPSTATPCLNTSPPRERGFRQWAATGGASCAPAAVLASMVRGRAGRVHGLPCRCPARWSRRCNP